MQLPRDILQRIVFLYPELSTSMYMSTIIYQYMEEAGIDIVIQNKSVRTDVLNVLSNYEYRMSTLCIEEVIDTNRSHNITNINDYCYNASIDRFVPCK